jgi:sugar-specific transcriptional regulator TrmB
METKVLEEIGLTKGEIKVYLTMLELGQSSAGEILKRADIQNSVFHFCINNLIEKGLASYIKKGKIRIYSAVDPDNLLVYLKDKENELVNILPELKKRQNTIKEKSTVEVFEGLKGITNMLQTQVKDAVMGKDEFLFMFPDLGERSEEIMNWYMKMYSKRFSKGILQKGIMAKRLEKFGVKKKKRLVKYVDFPIPANIGIFQDKLIIVSWEDKPKGVLIQVKDIVETQRKFFYKLWNMA